MFETKVTGIKNPTDDNAAFTVELAEGKGGKTVRSVPADLLILAGGSTNNIVRDRELSPAYAVTTRKAHSISVWDKLVPGHDNMLKITTNFRVKINNQDIANAVMKEGMDEFIRDFLDGEPLSYAIQDKYVEPISSLIRSDKVEPGIDVRQFENNSSVYLAYKIPNKIAELRGDVERFIRQDTDKERVGRCHAFLKALETHWHDAGMGFLTYNDPDYGGMLLQRDPSPVSHGSFYVEQVTGDDTSKIYRAPNGIKLIVAAAGDAVISPHFMTWSGLNAGRRTVDDLAAAVTKYLANPKDESVFTVQLHSDHARVKKFLLTRGQLFLEPIDEESKQRNAKAKAIEVLDGVVADQGPALEKGQVRVERPVPSENRYRLSWMRGAGGGVVSREITVNNDGSLQFAGQPANRRFTTYRDVYSFFEGPPVAF
jgi:hypothetical protein